MNERFACDQDPATPARKLQRPQVDLEAREPRSG